MSATARGSVIMRSWPVSISQSRSASSCRSTRVPLAHAKGRGAVDVGPGDPLDRGFVRQPQRLGEALPGMRGEFRLHPCEVRRIGNPVILDGHGVGPQHQFHPVDHAKFAAGGLHHRRSHVGERLALPWVRRIEIDQLADARERAIGNSGDHHAAIAVTDQDHVGEVLIPKHAQDIGDVRVQIYVGPKQV